MIQQFTPTHTAPASGLATYERPDPQLPPNASLDAGLEVQVIERLGQWARVLCSNGWSAWVDGAYLLPMAAAPAPALAPPPAPARPKVALTLAEAQANSAAAAAAARSRPAFTPPAPAYSQPVPAYAPPATALSAAPAAQPYSPYPAYPAAAPVSGATPKSGLGTGVLVSLAGAAAIGISSFLPWIAFSILGTTVSLTAFKLPSAFLWASTNQTLPANAASSGLNLGMLLIGIAVAGAGLCFVPGLDFLRRGAGMAGLVVASDFVRQIQAILSQPDAKQLQLTVFNLCGIGVWVGLAGGLLLLLGTGRAKAAAAR